MRHRAREEKQRRAAQPSSHWVLMMVAVAVHLLCKGWKWSLEQINSEKFGEFVTCTRTKPHVPFKLKVIVKFNMLWLVLCAGVTRSECGCSSIFVVCSYTFHCPVPPIPSGSSELIAVWLWMCLVPLCISLHVVHVRG